MVKYKTSLRNVLNDIYVSKKLMWYDSYSPFISDSDNCIMLPSSAKPFSRLVNIWTQKHINIKSQQKKEFYITTSHLMLNQPSIH